ncbi:UvrD-helicase domain-containing protein [Acidipropionibacterium virtanenii]|uniref:DNA 3'-5' helicase n=1 Tax=Acidipropionibacterium virtanenii TaxID=2057246 RepID=A0A344UXW3_9ACTN|nr:UvrD-helicase domain-containing protein [Acidipropionibacterium virtanenii]AXE40111.1 ATP-dependent DNA helicase Rep [Acidipropionibacterium virtanenii]
MAESTLIMTKQANDIDGSVKQKAYTFLQKLINDDSAPGLHIEPIVGAVDRRVRTGRVDDKYRAVLFKLAGETPTYVVHGIWMHDEAIRQARITKFRMNPVNGVAEIIQEEAAAEPETQPESRLAVVEPEVAAPAEEPPRPQPLLSVSMAELVELGIDSRLAQRAVQMTDDRAFNALVTPSPTSQLPTWQSEALLALATGSSLDDVRRDLFEAPEEVAAEGRVDSAPEEPVVPGSDQELIAALKKPASQMQFAKIKGADELRRVIEDGDFGAWRVFLHPVQRTWVQKNTNGPLRLAGGAGTGKTVVLVHRARRLANDRPDARIVMTTFTRNLADDLASSLKSLDPQVPQVGLGENGVHVTGIDALASAVIRSAQPGELAAAAQKVLGAARADVGGRVDNHLWGTVAGEVSELPEKLRNARFLESEYEMVVLPNRIVDEAGYLRVRRPGRGVRLNKGVRQAVWQAVARYREEEALQGCADFAEKAAIAAECLKARVADGGHVADHVLVDEGQDLKPSHWMLIRALVGARANDIFIAEDGHQRIYGQKVVLSHYGIETRGRSRRLTLNYRTTAENLRWATARLKGLDYADLDGQEDTVDGYRSARHGAEPVVKSCSGLVEELDVTAEVLRGWISEARQSGRSEALAVLMRDKQQRDRVVSGLNERGVAARAVDRGGVGAGGVDEPVVMTMHRAKGTEFTKVLLFDVDLEGAGRMSHGYDFSEEDQADAQKRERSLLYVAASRARDELAIVHSLKKYRGRSEARGPEKNQNRPVHNDQD